MEAATRLLRAKLDAAGALLRAAAAAVPTGPLERELDAVHDHFLLSMGRLLAAARAGGEAERAAAQAECARVFAAEGFADRVDRIVERAEAALRRAAALRPAAGAAAAPPQRGRPPGGGAAALRRGPAAPELQRLVDVYPRGEGHEPPPAARFDFERCPACGAGGMIADAARSELCCGECGALRELVGTVFDDRQFYQQNQKAKSGTFNPNRHFQHWWVHIQARESEEELGDPGDPDSQCGERLLARLRGFVERDRRLLQRLTVNDVRGMLREAGRTDLNKNVALILKKLTGRGPPALSDAVAARAENLFTKAIEVGEQLRRADRTNRHYYPFYIFKILDLILPPGDRESRRVLYYIYVQSQDTVEADDADWEAICAELPELSYRPTDRALGLQYGP